MPAFDSPPERVPDMPAFDFPPDDIIPAFDRRLDDGLLREAVGGHVGERLEGGTGGMLGAGVLAGLAVGARL